MFRPYIFFYYIFKSIYKTYIFESLDHDLLATRGKKQAKYSAEYVVHCRLLLLAVNMLTGDFVVVVSNSYFTLNARGGKVYTGIARNLVKTERNDALTVYKHIHGV